MPKKTRWKHSYSPTPQPTDILGILAFPTISNKKITHKPKRQLSLHMAAKNTRTGTRTIIVELVERWVELAAEAMCSLLKTDENRKCCRRKYVGEQFKSVEYCNATVQH
jgi:hypothetical protein